MTRKVTCVRKPDRYSTHEHITHIGGYGWEVSRETAISQIENSNYVYYTTDTKTGDVALVHVVYETGKLPYLRTHADGQYNNNLLELAECPLYRA